MYADGDCDVSSWPGILFSGTGYDLQRCRAMCRINAQCAMWTFEANQYNTCLHSKWFALQPGNADHTSGSMSGRCRAAAWEGESSPNNGAVTMPYGLALKWDGYWSAFEQEKVAEYDWVRVVNHVHHKKGTQPNGPPQMTPPKRRV